MTAQSGLEGTQALMRGCSRHLLSLLERLGLEQRGRRRGKSRHSLETGSSHVCKGNTWWSELADRMRPRVPSSQARLRLVRTRATSNPRRCKSRLTTITTTSSFLLTLLPRPHTGTATSSALESRQNPPKRRPYASVVAPCSHKANPSRATHLGEHTAAASPLSRK